MVARNDITGDKIQTRESSKELEENWDKIFPPKKKEKYVPPPIPVEGDKNVNSTS